MSYPDIHAHPGLLYVAATLLPLASFLLLLLIGGLRLFLRSCGDSPAAAGLYRLLGGDTPGRMAAYIATGAIGLAFVLCAYGFVLHAQDDAKLHSNDHEVSDEKHDEGHEAQIKGGMTQEEMDKRWSGRLDWAYVGPLAKTGPASVLQLGYRIDTLSAVMFAMVTFIATLIHIFSIGYMSEELDRMVTDHHVHTAEGHLHRRGRFGRFFLFLSLFCFSMLNLILADNLFQVFISWELVGICSYLLVGFYYERQSASNAAIKAFVTNRIGDAGFIIGLLIIWTYLGTFNFQEIFSKIRAADGTLIPNAFPAHWLLVAAGLGIFLGCVGKSAQFPLHVWLPDAMEGPTPVSALIHAATMVAAGVYLVGRTFPLFTEESRLVIAYTGGITLFMAATVALVMTDIKKVLAYSTVSQLGYMMLALGVGGWVAGLFHLITHAFFKALLFLCSGSVIYGCHHEQEMTKMGGLFPKMRITALTMLTGVLAIAGIPFFSGWYSKDAILAQAFGFARANPEHGLLFLLPLITAGITAFYMFRMWFMTFTGKPRDHHVHEHAHESPATMTVPLIILAIFSVIVAWGWPVWNAESSLLAGHIHHAEHQAVLAEFGHPEGVLPTAQLQRVHEFAHEGHALVGGVAFGIVILAIVFASLLYYFRVLDPALAKAQFPGLHAFLWNKWYFDELYSVILVRPGMVVAGWCRAFDLRFIDGFANGLARWTVWLSWLSGRIDLNIVDGLVNLIARVVDSVAGWLRNVQTGYLRNYVLFLVLAVIGIFAVLSYLVTLAMAG